METVISVLLENVTLNKKTKGKQWNSTKVYQDMVLSGLDIYKEQFLVPTVSETID